MEEAFQGITYRHEILISFFSIFEINENVYITVLIILTSYDRAKKTNFTYSVVRVFFKSESCFKIVSFFMMDIFVVTKKMIILYLCKFLSLFFVKNDYDLTVSTYKTTHSAYTKPSSRKCFVRIHHYLVGSYRSKGLR